MNNTIRKKGNDFVVMPLEYNVKFSAMVDQVKIIQKRMVILAATAGCTGRSMLALAESIRVMIEINKLRLLASQPVLPTRYRNGGIAFINDGRKQEMIIGRGGKIIKI